MILTWKKPGELVICIALSKDQSKPITLFQGVNKIDEETWGKMKTNPQVKAMIEADDLVVGVDASAANSDAAKKLTKAITELSSREARDMIPTVTDKAVLEVWLKQENEKGRRAEVVGALRGQLRLIAPAVTA